MSRALRPAALAGMLSLFLLAGLPAGAAPMLRFTGSLNGRLEGCDCKVSPAPGLSKIAAWIRAEHDPLTDVLVDTGDVLDGFPDDELASAILDTYRDLGYAAVAVGDNDLASGAADLLERRGQYPLLCNNLSILSASAEWTPFSPEPLLVRAGDRSIGIMALLDPEFGSALAPATRSTVRIADPAPRAAALEAELRKRGADTVVLLYHGSRESAVRLLDRVSGIAVALVAHGENRAATVVRGTVVASSGNDGRRVWSLDLGGRRAAGRAASLESREFDARFGPDDPAVSARARAYSAALRARLRGSSP